jgi:hypothetical protein
MQTVSSQEVSVKFSVENQRKRPMTFSRCLQHPESAVIWSRVIEDVSAESAEKSAENTKYFR